MKDILKVIKGYILIIIRYIIKAYLFFKIYNWFLPVLFGFPEITPIQSIGLILSMEFLLSDKADHIYSDDTPMEMSTLCDIVRYLILFSVMYIIKIIMRI